MVQKRIAANLVAQDIVSVHGPLHGEYGLIYIPIFARTDVLRRCKSSEIMRTYKLDGIRIEDIKVRHFLEPRDKAVRESIPSKTLDGEITVLSGHGAVARMERSGDIPAPKNPNAHRKDGVETIEEGLCRDAAVIELSMGDLALGMDTAVSPTASTHLNAVIIQKGNNGLFQRFLYTFCIVLRLPAIVAAPIV